MTVIGSLEESRALFRLQQGSIMIAANLGSLDINEPDTTYLKSISPAGKRHRQNES